MRKERDQKCNKSNESDCLKGSWVIKTSYKARIGVKMNPDWSLEKNR